MGINKAWRNARDQGAIAAANMIGAGVTYDAVPSFWSDQYELTLRIAGLTDAASHSVCRDLGEGLSLTFHLADDGRLVAASSIGPDSRALFVMAPEPDVQDAYDAAPAAFDDQRGGLGLALPIARRVIERHGGRIWAPAQVEGTDARAARSTNVISLPLCNVAGA